MTSQFIAAAASVALLGAGFTAVDGTRSAESLPMTSVSVAQNDVAGGNRCRVDVIRSAPGGAADITRSVLTDGSCVCTITTGPAGGNGNAESIVANLIRDKTCDGAPAPSVDGAKPAGFVGPATIIPAIILGTAGAGGLAVAAGNDSAG